MSSCFSDLPGFLLLSVELPPVRHSRCTCWLAAKATFGSRFFKLSTFNDPIQQLIRTLSSQCYFLSMCIGLYSKTPGFSLHHGDEPTSIVLVMDSLSPLKCPTYNFLSDCINLLMLTSTWCPLSRVYASRQTSWVVMDQMSTYLHSTGGEFRTAQHTFLAETWVHDSDKRNCHRSTSSGK